MEKILVANSLYDFTLIYYSQVVKSHEMIFYSDVYD